jgi:hypothetical protein
VTRLPDLDLGPRPRVRLTLPDDAGVVIASALALEHRPDGQWWTHVAVPSWGRWDVPGRPGVEELAPTEVYMWAPAAAVERIDGEDYSAVPRT